jgi:hypothetical protein
MTRPSDGFYVSDLYSRISAEGQLQAAASGKYGGECTVSRGDETEDEPSFLFEDIWPDDKPFPLTDAECARLVRGHPVRWHGTLEEALHLPGMYKLMDGWIYVRRT